MARTLPALADVAVTRLKGVGRGTRRRRWPSVGIAHRARPAHPLPAPLPRPHQRAPHRRARRRARRPWSSSRCKRASTPCGPGSGKAMVTADVTDGVGLPAGHVLQPAVAGAPAERGHRRWSLFGKVERFRGPPPDDEPGGRPGRRPTGRIVPSTRSPRRPGSCSWEVGRLDDRGARRGRASFADPVARRGGAIDWSWSDRDRAFHAHPSAPSPWPTAMDGPAAPGVRRAAAGAADPGACASGQLERDDAGHRATTSAARWCAASTSGLPFPLTGAQQRAIAEIDADLAGPHPMHRLLQGDVGSGKTVVAVTALLVAVQGGHQGALMAPTEVLAEQHHAGVQAPARRASRVADASTTLLRRAAAAGRAAHQPHDRGRAAPASSPGWPTVSVDILIGTHALHPGGGRVPVARRRRDRRAAPLRRRAAGRAAGEGRRRGRARRAGDDGHADPAHGGHDRLRRPRRRRCSTSCRPAARRSPPRWARGPSSRRPAVWATGPRRGGRRAPGLRRVPADRRESEKLEVALGARRPTSGWRPASWPACGSGCCTAGCRPARRRRSWPPSASGGSTCWSPPP